jgi:O-antigen/teichoic acid export membrane protein
VKLASIQLGAILILQTANPLIAAIIGTAAIPPYEAVSRIAATLMTLALLIVNSSAPFLSMAWAAGELGKFRLLLVRNLRLGLGVMVVLCAFVAVNGDRMVSVWLGRPLFCGCFCSWCCWKCTMSFLRLPRWPPGRLYSFGPH